jgi:acetyltransferase-like isoleucine patch superfamily enzyme
MPPGENMNANRVVSAPKKVREQIADGSSSPLQRYRRLVLGSTSLGFLLRFELTVLLAGGLPGALGLQMRQLLYPPLLGRVGRGTLFGRGLVLRHPEKIRLGSHVIVDDGCVLDARGEANDGITLGDEVMLGRNVVLNCKEGDLRLGDRVDVGAYSILQAVGSSGVSVGSNVMMGPYVHLVGGSHYRFDRTDVPLSQQGLDLRGGVRIEDNVWLGSKVTVLDGVTIGRDAIVGAGAVVTKDIPPFAVAAGNPARVIRVREHSGGAI